MASVKFPEQPQLPQQKIPAQDSNGITRNWYFWFQSIQRWIQPLFDIVGFLQNMVVYGIVNSFPLDPSTKYLDGTLVVLTDDNQSIYQVRGKEYIYVAGFIQATQSQLAGIAAGFAATNKGQLIEVTDYAHILRWTGTAWEWGPGENGSNYFVDGTGTAPNSVGWHACDGATVKYLKSDGTLSTNVTLPDETTAGYVKSGATYTGSPVSATAPTLTNPTVNSNTTGISIADHSTAANTPVTGAATRVTTANHVITDPGHGHTLSGGSVGTNGEPVHTVYPRFFRL